MSIFGALNSSVTGLQAQSDSLGVISDNISNVNTTGYKANKSNFAQLVTTAPTETSYNPGGVQFRPSQEIGQQGILNSSEVTTDLGIDGNGFFAVRDSAGNVDANELKYTRTGNFRVNDEGDLENQNGFLLQGWQLNEDANGNLTPPADKTNPGSLQTVNVKGFSGIARATKNVNVGANLPPNLPVNESRSTTVRIFDSEGTSHNLKLDFTRDRGDGEALPANEFRVDIHAPTLSDDEQNPQSALFGGKTTDITNLTDGENIGQTLLRDITDRANGTDTTTPAAATGRVTVAGQEFQITDNGGTGIDLSNVDSSATGAGDSISGNDDGILNTDEIKALVNDANTGGATTGGGLGLKYLGDDAAVGGAGVNADTNFEVAGTVGGAASEDLANLVQSTAITNSGAANATFDDRDNNSNQETASFDLLGAGPRIRLQQTDGTNAIDDNGDQKLQAGELDEADLIELDRDDDNNFDAGTDLRLAKSDDTVNGTTYDRASRVSTVVQFNGDGSIRQIKSSGLATNSPQDALALSSNQDGTLNLNVDFANRQFRSPGGSDASEPQQVNLNLGTPQDPDNDGVLENEKRLDGLTSFENPEGFQINELEQDGLQFGNFTGVDVDEEGIVTANFSNGERREIFQIPVATFNNPNGLEQNSGTVFEESRDSGEVLLNEAGVGGAGSVAPGALEDSTVELSTEFTNMIETQRAYSASTRVVTTSDEMLQEITNATR